MAATNLGFTYHEEVFNYRWRTAPDPVLTNLIETGVLVQDAELAQLISNGSNLYTYPIYNVLDETEPGIYNGVEDVAFSELDGTNVVGVVYGRQQGWKAKQFIKDFNSNADPMGQILSGTIPFWQKWRQGVFVKLLDTLTKINNADFASHVSNIASTTATVSDANLINVNTLNDLQVKACGDMSDEFTLAIMHSVVANRLRNLAVLEYLKYTDASGIERPTKLARIGQLLVIVNDRVPVVDSTTATGQKEYTTFICGKNLIGFAKADVTKPSEVYRDPVKNGGVDMIINRLRESMLPYGFTFTASSSVVGQKDGSNNVGVTNELLFNEDNWDLIFPAKSIRLAKLVTNG